MGRAQPYSSPVLVSTAASRSMPTNGGRNTNPMPSKTPQAYAASASEKVDHVVGSLVRACNRPGMYGTFVHRWPWNSYIHITQIASFFRQSGIAEKMGG